MSKQIVIAEQHRIAAVFSEDQIQELVVATGSHQVSDIYLGVVENVLPGIDAAFVNIGDAERNGFIHVTDLGPLRLKRSAGAITELLTPQQKVLIQVMKEPTGNKGPRLTGNITLPGRYLVLMPFGRGVNLSRRIRNENDRNRLRALAILIKPAGMGLLVRTEAEGVPEDAIIEDLEFLQKQWEITQQKATSTRAPALLNRDDDFIQRVLRDLYTAEVNRIVVDSGVGLKRVKQNLMNWSGGKLPQGVFIDQHREPAPILEYFRVNAAIREALKPRVDLPSGGYIIIERTEALTVIDVNSGSFTRSATARETVLWTNCEAATEIARQLRLRNIAGVIIVDFIDMDARRDQLQVLEHFNKALRADKSRPQIAQLSELGLVELTRKRQGQNIYELFGRACPTCGGLGHLIHLPGETTQPEGEMVERHSNFRTPEITPPSPPRIVESRESSSSEFDLDASEDLQTLDLVNHPSYQERTTASPRRRRRTRPEVSGGSGRSSIASPKFPSLEETAASEGDSNEPAIVSNGTPIKLNREVNRESEERPPAPVREVKNAAQEPPQVVSVAMTPVEQQIYAHMGISPLVLYEGDIKNPKSTVLAIRVPGETEPQVTAVFPEAAVDSAPTPEIASEPVPELASELVPEPTPEIASEPAPEAEDSGLPEAAGSADSTAENAEETESATRRRRRRSSAAMAT